MCSAIAHEDPLESSLRIYNSEERDAIRKSARAIYEQMSLDIKVNATEKPHHWTFRGPPGSGKTTLVSEMISLPEHAHRFVVIDGDLIRSKFLPFQNMLIQGQQQGLSPLEADAIAFSKWACATAYIANSMLDWAHSDNRNFIRCSRFCKPFTGEIHMDEAREEYTLTNALVVASEAVCRTSIQRRIAAGGHPVSENSLRMAFDSTRSCLPVMAAYADHLQVFFRRTAGSAATLVAERDHMDHLTIHDARGFSAAKSVMKADYGVNDLRSSLRAHRVKVEVRSDPP